ncbi:MAG TPA: aquaporin, partial [Acidimicrobiales bacterium]|nr:aquaporin [Acidimicrobiales bacterium]
DAGFGGLSWREAAAYLPAQVAGCIGGAVIANLMFAEASVSISDKHRASGAHFLSEVVATLGLLLVIFALARTGRGRQAAAAVGAYIGTAYFFTSSTSFANPAIAIGRMFSNSFAGIAPSSVPVFVAAEACGAALGFGVIKALYPKVCREQAADAVFPHHLLDGNDAEPSRDDWLDGTARGDLAPVRRSGRVLAGDNDEES